MAQRCFLRAKLHHARLTYANPDYVGSVAIDADLLKRADIAPFEQVDIYNVDNGERLTTYAIPGEPGEIGLNGAAARKGEAGQKVIIAAYAWLDEAEMAEHNPAIVILDHDNKPVPNQ
ncbi:aspartate 1-decarboxylase [Desulfohalovibrio reitneri]|uniref:aspartate 1-decarboxylase n=1 Tax=Desulfohalovibrio reitneri TaxID=1307759 RepID=UPI0004A77D96|nr:aspartate 1-decarboxylase [Desulfohalovibrio reitneri]